LDIEQLIKRINELYKKQKECELSCEEKDEQASLRKQYLLGIREQMKAQLDNIDIKEPDGTIHPLNEKTH